MKEHIPGTQAVAQRIAIAHADFEQLIMEKGFTRDEARKAAATLLRVKAAKLDPVIGRIDMRHGAFWDAAVLRNAAAGGAK